MVVLKLLVTVDASVSLFHMLCDFVIISLLFEGYVPLLAPYPGRNMSPPPARTNHVSPPPGCQRQSCSQCSLANGGGTWPFLDRHPMQSKSFYQVSSFHASRSAL